MKKKSYILIIVSLMFQIALHSQTYSDLTTDSEIHDFIKKNKNKFGGNTLDSKILQWNKCDLFKNLKDCWSSRFVQQNSDSIINKKTLKDFQTKYYSIEKYKAETFIILKNKKHKKKFYQVSTPIISEDGKIAIIKIRQWCGDECGYGGILILKKHRNKWIRVDFRCTWIS